MDSLYELTDSAYDTEEIRVCSKELGHAAIIDTNPCRDGRWKEELKREELLRHRIGEVTPEPLCCRQHSTVDRVNGRFMDEFGGRHLRVGGQANVLCQLMFGILALTVDQLLRLTL